MVRDTVSPCGSEADVKSEHLSVACIILNWNGGNQTAVCVQSVVNSKGVVPKILVIDNGSVDGSDVQLAESFHDITILKNPENFGVAKAWNMGVDWAMQQGVDAVFFLNNDATVEASCLMQLMAEMDHSPDVGIVSPRILNGNRGGEVWFDGGFLNVFGDAVHRKRPLKDFVSSYPEDFATGCAMLVRIGAFARVGGFDESLFVYSEDVDFSLRVRAAGLAIAHVPSALVTHYPSTGIIANRGKWFRDYYVTRNKLLVLSKYLGGIRWMIFLIFFFFVYLAIPCVYFTVTGQWQRVAAVCRGVGDFMRGRSCGRYR